MNIYVSEPTKAADACVIWMHGLGADAQDMAGLAEQLQVEVSLRHVFMDAPVRPVTLNQGMPMRAWYDILGMTLHDREDRPGILQSEALIREVITRQMADGVSSKQIYLAGFSQGGAMALFTGLQTPLSLGGIIALSAYLPLATECSFELPKSTPLFLAGGAFDPMVLPQWTKQTVNGLQARGFLVDWHEYPIEHSISIEEVRDLGHWLNHQVTSLKRHEGGLE